MLVSRREATRKTHNQRGRIGSDDSAQEVCVRGPDVVRTRERVFGFGDEDVLAVEAQRRDELLFAPVAVVERPDPDVRALGNRGDRCVRIFHEDLACRIEDRRIISRSLGEAAAARRFGSRRR